MKLTVKKEIWDRLVIGLSYLLILIMLLNFLGEYYENKARVLKGSFEEVRSLDLNNWIGLNGDLINYYIVTLEYDLKPTTENFDRMNKLKEEFEKSKQKSLEHLKNPTYYGVEEFLKYSKNQRWIQNSEFVLIIFAVIYSLFLVLIKIKTK